MPGRLPHGVYVHPYIPDKTDKTENTPSASPFCPSLPSSSLIVHTKDKKQRHPLPLFLVRQNSTHSPSLAGSLERRRREQTPSLDCPAKRPPLPFTSCFSERQAPLAIASFLYVWLRPEVLPEDVDPLLHIVRFLPGRLEGSLMHPQNPC